MKKGRQSEPAPLALPAAIQRSVAALAVNGNLSASDLAAKLGLKPTDVQQWADAYGKTIVRHRMSAALAEAELKQLAAILKSAVRQMPAKGAKASASAAGTPMARSLAVGGGSSSSVPPESSASSQSGPSSQSSESSSQSGPSSQSSESSSQSGPSSQSSASSRSSASSASSKSSASSASSRSSRSSASSKSSPSSLFG